MSRESLERTSDQVRSGANPDDVQLDFTPVWTTTPIAILTGKERRLPWPQPLATAIDVRCVLLSLPFLHSVPGGHASCMPALLYIVHCNAVSRFSLSTPRKQCRSFSMLYDQLGEGGPGDQGSRARSLYGASGDRLVSTGSIWS
jgi:hypothetical protein